MVRLGSTRTARAREMGRVLREWERSGLTLTEFGRQRGIAYSTLTWWQRVFRHTEQTTAWADRGGGTSGPEKAPVFTELKLAASAALGNRPSVLEVVLPSGHVVRVPAGFELATLRAVLALLESPASC